jgi:hypothetical protein
MLLKSFMSEHTAEYVLVTDLVRRLAPQFTEIIPIFFWSTREGNSTAAQTMSEVTVRVLTAFARRPKILTDDRVMMKINRELLQYSGRSSNFGIPVVAGIPLVSSLSRLRLNSSCSWFEMTGSDQHHEDHYIEVMLDGTSVLEQSGATESSSPLSDERIRELVHRSPTLSWLDAVAMLRSIRSEQSEFSRFPFFGGYKPFHLILPIA